MPTAKGLTKYIESPEKLWEYFVAFQKWIEQNPYVVVDWVGKDAERVERKKQRPTTFIGFEKWLAMEGIISDLSSYERNENNSYEDYLPTIARIRKICNGEIVEGAAAGVYNPMIGARLAGLVDKSEQTVKQEPRVFNVD